MVTTSDMCIEADTIAGGIPSVNKREVVVTLYPIPKNSSVN